MKSLPVEIKERAKDILATADNGSKECGIYNDGFLDGTEWGYKEAMRWRDPEVELPKNEEIVQVKCHSNNDTWYEQLRYLKAHNVWACDQTIGAKVVGWKPIE